MVNRLAGTTTKMLTLIPILVAVYYFDLPHFAVVFTSSNLLPFFLIPAVLLALGVVMKWRILRVRVELSRSSFPLGMLLLAISVVFYVYAPYSSSAVLYRFESFYFLVLSYVAFRIGAGVLRALAPLLVMLAFSFSPMTLYPSLNNAQFVLLSYGSYLLLFFVFIRLRLRAMLLPTIVVFFGLVWWVHPVLPLLGRQILLAYLIPLPLLALVSRDVRAKMLLPRAEPAHTCSAHQVLSDGFCSICGRKLAPAIASENIGAWGLLAVVVAAFLMIFTTVPALTLSGGAPYDAHFSTQGFSGVGIPLTPTGWQVNSTNQYPSNGIDVYKVKMVFVPLFHPETKNYTMVYELSTGIPTSAASSGDIPGWNRVWNNFTGYGPFQGYLTAYTALGTTMLVYNGKTGMLFLSGSSFVGYNVGVSFERQFKNTNIGPDASEFMADLSALWLPAFKTDTFYSGWTGFLSDTYSGVLLVSTFVALVTSAAVIIWVAYRARLYDDRLDRFLSIATTQPGQYWSYLSGLLRMPHHAATGSELIKAVGNPTSMSNRNVDSSLRELESRHLVRRSLVERGSDIISVWALIA